MIIELKVFVVSRLELFHALIALEIYILVFDCGPKPLDKDIVQGPTSPVHTDFDISAVPFFEIIRRCGLAFLICVEDFRRPCTKASCKTLRHQGRCD
jgi:hypothetical protein